MADFTSLCHSTSLTLLTLNNTQTYDRASFCGSIFFPRDFAPLLIRAF